MERLLAVADGGGPAAVRTALHEVVPAYALDPVSEDGVVIPLRG